MKSGRSTVANTSSQQAFKYDHLSASKRMGIPFTDTTE
jgi:hypothetical protein